MSDAVVESPRIRRLPDDLANQIAAGEVVERPSSAVKELIENALDAGATRIEVTLEAGGLDLIRVVDNGRGMSPEDAALCIERHATSKLQDREGLFRIATLGFRGEALPSIASVSHFELLTKPAGALGATRVLVEGGRLQSVETAAGPVGTAISVRRLFFNTPARRKFLRTEATEVRHVVEAMQRLALAFPGVHFRLQHKRRTLLELPAVSDPLDRIHGILGAEDSARMHPAVPAVQDGVEVEGWFSEPGLTRRNAGAIWAFVNGRFVRDRTIQQAVRVAYEGLLDRGRHPIVVLRIRLPLDRLDVNVHPMKTEVRFHDSSAVFRAVRRAVHQGLAAGPWLPGPSGPLPDAQPGAPAAPGGASREAAGGAADGVASRQTGLAMQAPARTYTLHRSASAEGEGGASTRQPERVAPPGGATALPRTPLPRGAQVGGRGAEALPAAGYFGSLHYIGGFRGAYLLASDGTHLVVVDQHAAHERITFEHLRRSWAAREAERQPLLFPERLRFDSLRAATLQANLQFFAAIGFEIEPFGGNDFALKSVPALLAGARYRPLIEDALDDLGDAENSMRFDEQMESLLSRMACHGSVRAGDRLTREEVDALFAEMDRIDFGANCPHGRPVYFRLSLEEIERRFERR